MFHSIDEYNNMTWVTNINISQIFCDTYFLTIFLYTYFNLIIYGYGSFAILIYFLLIKNYIVTQWLMKEMNVLQYTNQYLYFSG